MKLVSLASIYGFALMFCVVCLTGLAPASVARAATLNLNPGESAVINPSVATTVVCAAGSSRTDCQVEAVGFERRYDVCKQSTSPSTCFTNEWTTFKNRHPECLTEAFDVCIRLCEESTSPSTCYNTCR